MPNWISNTVSLEGHPTILSKIAESDFDFQQLHPCPFITDETTIQEGWYEWCNAHWGTKWSPSDVDCEYTDGDLFLEVYFQTAWSPPHGLLTYLTIKYPTLTITNAWSDEADTLAGHAIYSKGKFEDTWIDTSCYTTSALETFAEDHDWFCYDNYNSDSDSDPDLQTTIQPTIYKSTYANYIIRNTK